ncbi:MAG: D-glycero-alpha-D-manno-heptose 1-phosphate guanylyltransferase [Rhodobiaceae bacterium UBA7378]|nr:MAG: D-glycero-alpha-D-manno-heptose 1-phosphate guanylyltransferase [Rhodobiaceae bacterium UBA7378]
MAITHAMVLAAGLGTRMRARADDPPKPLTQIAGRSLLDRMIDRLENAGVQNLVVNLHHKADHITDHLAQRAQQSKIAFSDERAALLETGGGVKNALSLLGADPFFVCNADILWQENTDTLSALARYFDPKRMDVLLMLAPRTACSGYDGAGDFDIQPDATLTRRAGATAPYVFCGVQVLCPGCFDRTPTGAFSLNLIYDQAAAAGRLYGLVLDGTWMHVGTPEGRAAAENILASNQSS